MITVTPAVQSKIDNAIPPIQLFKFNLNGVPPLYITNAAYDISWDGQTWQSNGYMLSSATQDRLTDIRTSGGEIILSGVDLVIASIMLNNNQIGGRVDTYDAWLDNDNGGVISEPYLRDAFYIDDWGIKQSLDSATVALTMSGEWADFEVVKGIKTTDASIKRLYPDDDIFLYSKSVKETVKWGGK